MMRFGMAVAVAALGLLGGCTVESFSDKDDCFLVDIGDGRADSQCSHTCSTDVDCPGGGACYSLFGDPSGATICYQRCSSDFDCFNGGFVCTTATMGGVPTDAICIPR